MTRVIVADDSAFIRKLLSQIINTDPDLETVATAKDGEELCRKLVEYTPDVVTLDISMPVMDGISALKKIMDENPLPVVMISALSDEENVFTCLEHGAVDFIAKTSGLISMDMHKKRDAIIKKIKDAPHTRIEKGISSQDMRPVELEPDRRKEGALVMGASTGGPKAIESILQTLPSNFPLPIVIVQHIPAEFIGTFSKRLNQNCSLPVMEIGDEDTLQRGTVHVVPIDCHVSFSTEGKQIKMRLSRDEQAHEYRPRVDETMKSLAPAYREHLTGVILSGMGTDGVEGMKSLKEYNAYTIVQEESSAIAPLLPHEVSKAGVADKVIPLSQIAQEIMERVK